MKIPAHLWSSSDFDTEGLTRYAQPVMRREAVQGIFTLGLLTMALTSGLALLYNALGDKALYAARTAGGGSLVAMDHGPREHA